MIDRKRRGVKNWDDMTIVIAKSIGGFKIRYKFKNGRVMEYDMEKFARRNEKYFKPILDDPEIMKSLNFEDGDKIYWSDMMDIPSDFLYCSGTIVKEY